MTTNYTALNSTDDWSRTSAVVPGTVSTAMETWTENLDNLDTTKRMGPVPTTIYTLIELVGKNYFCFVFIPRCSDLQSQDRNQQAFILLIHPILQAMPNQCLTLLEGEYLNCIDQDGKCSYHGFETVLLEAQTGSHNMSRRQQYDTLLIFRYIWKRICDIYIIQFKRHETKACKCITSQPKCNRFCRLGVHDRLRTKQRESGWRFQGAQLDSCTVESGHPNCPCGLCSQPPVTIQLW